jgi:hypothetical protein
MNRNKKTAKIVGALFLTAMAASLLGGGLVESVLSSPEPFKAVSENETLVIAGTLLELLNAIAVIGIAVILFSYLRQHSLNIALGYLGFRVVEAVFCSVIIIGPLSLIALSQVTMLADAAQAAALSAAGVLAIAQRASVSDVLIPVFFGLGALLFYASAYQSGLLPRPLAAWGLLGAALILAITLLQLVNPGLSMSLQMALALPMITNEIFLGFWLLVKGFKIRAAAPGMTWQTSLP